MIERSHQRRLISVALIALLLPAAIEVGMQLLFSWTRSYFIPISPLVYRFLTPLASVPAAMDTAVTWQIVLGWAWISASRRSFRVFAMAWLVVVAIWTVRYVMG